MKRIALTLLAVPAFAAAQQPAAGGGAPGGMSMKTEKASYAPFVATADTDHDGKVSAAEWKATGISDNPVKFFDANKDGALTQAEMDAFGSFAGMDSNKDGKISVAEFLTFDKARAGGGGGAPGGPGGQPGN